MSLPFTHSPRDATHRPWATRTLVLANVALFCISIWAGFGHEDAITDATGWLGVHPSLTAALVSTFVHGGWLHLLGNMLFLAVYGPSVERRVGRVGFVLLYCTAGVAASIAASLLSPSTLPMIGASGAVGGVIGAYLVAFSKKRLWLSVGWFFVKNVGMALTAAQEQIRAAHRGSGRRLDQALKLWKQGALVDARDALKHLIDEGGHHADEARVHLDRLSQHPFFTRRS